MPSWLGADPGRRPVNRCETVEGIVTDTTNSPDEPSVARVRTGEHSPVGGDGAVSPTAAAGGDVPPDPGRPEPEPRSGAWAADRLAVDAQNGSTVAKGSSGGTDDVVGPGSPSVLTPPNGIVPVPPAHPPAPVVPSGAVVTPPSGFDQAEQPAPTPTLGPVPDPGPAAAAPPPWRRMPESATATAGRSPSHAAEPDPLDDLPTTFVEPAGPAGAASAGSAAPPTPGPVGSAAGQRPGWATLRRRGRPPRRAALQLKRLDPWSVLKVALMLSLVLFLIFLVAVGVLYGVLDGMGLMDRLNGTYSDLVSGDGAAGGEPLISAWRVLGYAALIGMINSVLFAVAVTVGAFVYNACADLVGGIEVTLSERD